MEKKTVHILHTNDIHGRDRAWKASRGSATSQTGDPGRELVELDREGLVGGFARLSSAVSSLRDRCGRENVLLLDGGDTFSDSLIGNLTRGEAAIRVMNEIGYRFMSLGNHDFDYGSDRTRELQSIARFPMRAANVKEKESGETFLGRPWELFSVARLEVAVIGLGYHNTHETGNPANFEDLEFLPGPTALAEYLPEIRPKADLVVVLSHQGTVMDRELARQVRGVDLIIGAHSHDRIPPERVNGVWMVQALSDGAVLADTAVTMESGRIVEIRTEFIVLWAEEYPEDEKIARLLAGIRAPHAGTLEEVIARAVEPVGRSYRSRSPFDLLAGEILRKETGAEMAVLPGIGYGLTLQPGPVTREDLYTLLPHPAKVELIRLQGRHILEVLEQSATNQAPDHPSDSVGGIIQTAGVRWTVDYNRERGSRVSDVRVNGVAIDPHRAYTVATNSGMLKGLHRYTSLKKGEHLRSFGTLSDMVEKGLREMGEIRPPRSDGVEILPRRRHPEQE